jgi:hypothetical protein
MNEIIIVGQMVIAMSSCCVKPPSLATNWQSETVHNVSTIQIAGGVWHWSRNLFFPARAKPPVGQFGWQFSWWAYFTKSFNCLLPTYSPSR